MSPEGIKTLRIGLKQAGYLEEIVRWSEELLVSFTSGVGPVPDVQQWPLTNTEAGKWDCVSVTSGLKGESTLRRRPIHVRRLRCLEEGLEISVG